jgi:Fe-S cluster assembly iron-binding protein IscA
VPLEITEGALDVIRRAYEAAQRFSPSAKVRLRRLGDQVETEFAEDPEEGDEVIEREGLVIMVEDGISGTLDVSAEHSRLIVR